MARPFRVRAHRSNTRWRPGSILLFTFCALSGLMFSVVSMTRRFPPGLTRSQRLWIAVAGSGTTKSKEAADTTSAECRSGMFITSPSSNCVRAFPLVFPLAKRIISRSWSMPSAPYPRSAAKRASKPGPHPTSSQVFPSPRGRRSTA